MSITAGELSYGVPAVERHDRDELDLGPLGVAFSQDLSATMPRDTPSRDARNNRRVQQPLVLVGIVPLVQPRQIRLIMEAPHAPSGQF